MYKFVAIDIDGTLLNSSGELSKRNIDTIKKTVNKGVKIVLTSGRVTDSAKRIAQRLDVDRYLICDNGASIYDVVEDKFIYSSTINKETALRILNTCINNNIYYMIFTTKEIIVKDLKHMALAFYKQRHNCNDEATGVTQIRYGGIECLEKTKDPIIRIVVCDQDRPIFNSIVNRMKEYADVELISAPHVSNKIIKENGKDILLSYSYAELLPKNANKWTAIKELTNKFNIKDDEIIAIGDNFNDIEMIRNAGLGVAMNNGSPVAKEVARVVAPSNDQDGVAVVLQQYVLSEYKQ